MGSSRVAGLVRAGGMEATGPRCLSAQLRTPVGSYEVHVHDLSALGARIEAERLPTPGMIVCLQRGDAVVFGVMAWREENQGGILFDEELDAQLFGSGSKEAEEAAAAAATRKSLETEQERLRRTLN